MQTLLEALLPIFFLILLGYLFKRIQFPSKQFWEGVDKFTYYVLIPTLLVYKLANAKVELDDGFMFVSLGMGTILIVLLMLVVINKFVGFEKKAFTSIVQGSLRFNTYVFLALIDALLGDSGLILAAFLITFLIPFLNIVCITIFSIYTDSKFSLKGVLLAIVKNPLIIACVLGGLINFFEITFPTIVNNTVSILSVAALPMGLLAVGVGLEFSHIKKAKKELITAIFFKLLYLPVLVYILASIIGLNDELLVVLVIFCSMPTATSAYILAKQLKGDVKLMSAIITFQTLLSIATIGVIINYIGL